MRDDLVYYAEGDGLEYEIWIDVHTDTKYQVPIEIVRDFDNAEIINNNEKDTRNSKRD